MPDWLLGYTIPIRPLIRLDLFPINLDFFHRFCYATTIHGVSPDVLEATPRFPSFPQCGSGGFRFVQP